MSALRPGNVGRKRLAKVILMGIAGAANLPAAFLPIPPGSWQGQGASDMESFGGGQYCSYTVTMQNVQLAFSVRPDGKITGVSAGATMIESTPSCAIPIIPQNNHTFTGSGTISGNTITLQLTGAASNNPKDVGAFTGTLNGSGQIQGTLTFTRTDLPVANFDWTTHHSVTLSAGAAAPPPYNDGDSGSTVLGLDNDATTSPYT